MEREIMRLLYFYSLNKKIFDELAFERIYNIFINTYPNIEKYFL